MEFAMFCICIYIDKICVGIIPMTCLRISFPLIIFRMNGWNLILILKIQGGIVMHQIVQMYNIDTALDSSKNFVSAQYL